MKYIFFSLVALIANSVNAQFQLSGKISGIHQAQTFTVNVPFDCWYYKQLSQPVYTDGDGFFCVSLQVKSPQSIFLDYESRRILLYAEPAKSLSVNFDSAHMYNTIAFAGGLKLENSFRNDIGLTKFYLFPQLWSDSTDSPDLIVAGIKKNQKDALLALDAVRKQTGPEFQAMTKADIEYYLPWKIWNIIYGPSNPMNAEREAWQKALQYVYQQQPLSNNKALNSYYYQNTITYYPRFLNTSAASKEAFEAVVQTVLKIPAADALAEIKQKGKRFWEFKALTSVLQGAALDRGIAAFLDNSVNIGELSWLQEAYSEYIFRFPKSIYRGHVDSIMKTYFATQETPLNDEIVFDEPQVFFTDLTEILSRHKGRVVYLDLWGSWCGPCRDQFAYNKAMKTYFAGKAVDFVYIAFERNRGNPVGSWKKTVNYYDLTGRHILVNAALQENIERLYKPGHMKGFPSYLLVDKHGKIRNPDAEQPSSGAKLYRQIEELLTEK